MLCTVWACNYDLEIGLLFGLAQLPTIFFTTHWFLSKIKFPQVFIASFYAIWIFHFPRGIFLIANPDRLTYPIDGLLTFNEHFYTLLNIFLYSLIWGVSLFLFIGKKAINIEQIDIENDRFFAKRQVVLLSAFFLMLFMFSMQISSKFLGDRIAYYFELIKLIIPMNYLLPLAVVYFFVFRKRLSVFENIIILTIMLLTVTGALLKGSKAVLLNLALFVFFGKLIVHPHFKISLPQFLGILVFVGFPLISSVLLMQMIRMQLKLFGAVNLGHLTGFIADNIDNPVFLFNALDNFTSRLNGYDGLLMTGIDQNTQMLNAFSAKNLLNSYLGKLIPMVSIDAISLGEAVGKYYSKVPEGFQHAGALGGFGTVKLLFFKVSYLGIVVISFIYSLILRLTSILLKDKSLFFIFLLLWLSSINLFMNSGNIDSIAQGISIWLIHLVFYYGLLLLLWATLESLSNLKKSTT